MNNKLPIIKVGKNYNQFLWKNHPSGYIKLSCSSILVDLTDLLIMDDIFFKWNCEMK